MNPETFFRHIGFKVIMTYFAWRTCDAAEWTAVYTKRIYDQNAAIAANVEAIARRPLK